jgi:hypothetical protein
MPTEDRNKRLNEEVGFHIEMATERNIRLGMTSTGRKRPATCSAGRCWKISARTSSTRSARCGVT